MNYEFEGRRSEIVVCPSCWFGGTKEKLNSLGGCGCVSAPETLQAVPAGDLQQCALPWKAPLQDAVFNPSSFPCEV